MPNYRLLALDMDGTLLTEDKTVSAENKYWIRRAAEAGVTVCFATGRGFQSALPYAEELELLDSPMVTVNGSEVWKRAGELHSRTLMDADDVLRLRNIALRFEEPWYWAYSVERVYNKQDWAEDALALEWLKFGYYTENIPVLQKMRQEAEAMGKFEITNSHPCNLELNPLGIHKAAGLRQVCTLLGIEMSQAVAAGDSLNDVSMIREAGLGVAMGNAQDAVKELADEVTATNKEDGVAQIIRRYILKDGE
ncbi:Cof-type HAD-IIB family hydrolase [Paenibacillus turpanensis]|uniref:Cof-type HAD-IIB family hydrolase n=1 Tax=Paenibacillus turpanensis TaxID=2689078 RepID=UPI00140783F0|nr:Cof-type HAD-IIB family hydrolase [Paenibacillus turpanensis]